MKTAKRIMAGVVLLMAASAEAMSVNITLWRGETAVPEGTPRPEISAIRVVGGNVYVTVRNTVPYLQYDLSSGDTPGTVSERANAPRGGAASGEDEITLVAPAKEGSAFFKVGRR